MSPVLKFLAASAAALALLGAAEARDRYGCNTSGDRTLGTIAGAVIGGVVGGQFGNDGDDRALGAVAGVLLGGAAGNTMAGDRDCGRYGQRDAFAEAGYGDRYDSRYDDYDSYDPYARNAYYQAFENADPYERVTWRNQGHANYVEAGDWYADDDGRDCREYEQVIYIDGRRQTATGTACRDFDGTWQIVE
ncbi:MAG: glycine zipper 2TM domain-containing protein [Micropepsaceae bacterium]